MATTIASLLFNQSPPSNLQVRLETELILSLFVTSNTNVPVRATIGPWALARFASHASKKYPRVSLGIIATIRKRDYSSLFTTSARRRRRNNEILQALNE